MIWKIYFFIFLVLSIPSFLGAYATTAEWVIDLSFLLVQMVSVLGFAWQKPFGNQKFWKVYAPLCVAWNLGHAFVAVHEIEPLIATMLFLPSLVCTCLYAYRDIPIWVKVAVQEALSVDQP